MFNYGVMGRAGRQKACLFVMQMCLILVSSAVGDWRTGGDTPKRGTFHADLRG